MPTSKQRSYEVAQVATIEESPSTIGVADSELYMAASLEEINARLDLMQSLGVTNVRIMVPWAGVQPLHPDTPFGLGAPRWDQLDKVVNAAAARGMGILGVLNSTPMWASQSTPLNGEPANLDRFAAFAKSVALRYGDKISAYEVWNEPNSIQFWNTLDPASYTEMLKKTYTALKQAAAQIGTDITVIGGVIGAGKTWPGLTLNPIDFVKGMYAAGAHGYFDALSFHPYNFEWKFSVGESLPWGKDMPLYQLNKIRELMDSFLEEGQEQVKIWITEYGAPTNKVSEATQAAFVRDIIEFWQTMQGAGPIFLYTIKDWLNAPADNDEANLGIFRPDGTMKPVGQVIKELIEFLTKPPTNPGTGPGTGPGSNPGNGSSSGNPIAALFKAIQGMFTSMFNFSGLFTAVGSMFTNFFNGIFGIKPKTASTTTTAMRTAAADTEAPVDGVETGTEVTAPAVVDEVVDTSGREDAVVTVLVDDAPAEVPATEVSVEVPVTEAPVEEVPPAEVPVEETPVEETPVDETPAQEAPEQEDEGTTPAEDKGEDVTAEDKGDDAGGKKADAEFSANPDKHDAVRPNLTARDELTVRTPRGPRTGLKAAREAGQRPAARSSESASASASSGADK
ncbi:cellulase family glycosylhydrolase [Mycobacterium sp. C31M]